VRPRVASAATLAVGLIATGVVFLDRAGHTRAAQAEELTARTARVSRQVSDNFGGPVEMMHAVASLIAATGDVRGPVFEQFARDAIRRQPFLYAIEWAPRVTRAERPAFEAAAQADGLAGYRILDVDAGGGIIPAPDRAVYFPLRYLVPMNDGRGYDVGGPGTAAERACQTGGAVASDHHHLVEDPPDRWSVYAIEPVWLRGERPADPGARCATVAGYVVLVFRLDPVMQAALAAIDLDGVDLVVRDVTPGAAEAAAPVGSMTRGGGDLAMVESTPGAAARVDARGALAAHATVAFVDRTWDVALAPSAPAGPPWPIAIVGVLGSILAAAVVFAVLRWRMLRRQLAHARRLGQYHLEQEIGRGGMGTVFRARHELLRRATALKLLTAPPDDAAALARFEREVRLTAELTHPNTIAIFDYGHTPDGRFYYAMEYIDGVTLHDVLEHDGEQSIARTIHLVKQVAGALREAHEVGLVHRDLKPSNLMITRRGGVADFVKVLDFGVVKQIGRPDVGGDGGASGTVGYSAPEALLGQAVDHRADLYSIGVTWYALLTLRLPFIATGEQEVAAAQVRGAAVPVDRLRPGLPPALVALVMQCLELDPARRVASAQALLDAIDGLGLPAWTAADAEAWWETRAPAIVAARRASLRKSARVPAIVTIERAPG
jgi:CHASE1-domain containing sensor protein